MWQAASLEVEAGKLPRFGSVGSQGAGAGNGFGFRASDFFRFSVLGFRISPQECIGKVEEVVLIIAQEFLGGTGSKAPRRAWAIRHEPVGLFVAGELGLHRIPFQRALQDQGNAADQDRIHGVNGCLGMADGWPPSANALEEVP